MSRCCVDRCSDTADGKVFFTFPASKTLRRKWLEAAPVKEKVTLDSVICNHHFLEHEYEYVRGKTRLKAKVVPSVFNTCQSKSPPKEPQQHVNDVNNYTPTTTDKNIPQSTKKKKSEVKNNKEIEQNGGLVKRQEPISPLDEANKDIEEIITNYQIKQIRPINREIEIEKLNGDTRENGERLNRVMEDMGDVVTIEEDADPVYIEVSVDKGGQGGDCLMVLESLQCEVDPGLFEPPPDYSDRKEDPISLLTSSDDDDVIIQEPRIDIVEVSDETDEDDRPLRKTAATQPARRGRRKKSGRKRGKSKVTVDTESVVYLPLYDLTPYHFSSAECRGEPPSVRAPAASPTVLRLCGRCGLAAASDAQLASQRRTAGQPATHSWPASDAQLASQRRTAGPPATHSWPASDAQLARQRRTAGQPATHSWPAIDARTARARDTTAGTAAARRHRPGCRLTSRPSPAGMSALADRIAGSGPCRVAVSPVCAETNRSRSPG